MGSPISSKRPLFCLNFERHVLAFMEKHNLLSIDKKMMVSVSGGVDSLALAEIFYRLNLPFELLHFNHGTRPHENKKEEELVSLFAKSRNLKLNVVHLEMSLDQKNFEKMARMERQKTYKKLIRENFWVYTAHHIDDSFEWSLMQSFKQSSVIHKLGIPVFNNGVARPFMCVSKKQIKSYAKKAQVNWLEDSSNDNLAFERNYMRKVIVARILKKYPKALSHYVAQSNELLLLEKKTAETLDIKKNLWGTTLISSDFNFHKEEIKKCIQELSNKERGQIGSAVEKLIAASKESFPFKGPMQFSGDVSAYLIEDHLLLANKNQRDYFHKLDLALVSFLKEQTQIPQPLFLNQFPFLLVGQKKSKKSSKFVHPLLPVTCMWLKNYRLSYVFTPLLPPIDRQKFAFDAVILDSSILGL